MKIQDANYSVKHKQKHWLIRFYSPLSSGAICGFEFRYFLVLNAYALILYILYITHLKGLPLLLDDIGKGDGLSHSHQGQQNEHSAHFSSLAGKIKWEKPEQLDKKVIKQIIK